MRPVDWDELQKMCEEEGCAFDRMKGDHIAMTRSGMLRPAVFPKKKGLTEDIVLGVGRTIGLTAKQVREKLGIDQKKKTKDKTAKKVTA